MRNTAPPHIRWYLKQHPKTNQEYIEVLRQANILSRIEISIKYLDEIDQLLGEH